MISTDLKTGDKKDNIDKLFNIDNEYKNKWPNTNKLKVSINSQKDWLTNTVNKNKNFDNKFIDVLATFTPKTKNILKDTECVIFGLLGIISLIGGLILLFLYLHNRPDNKDLKQVYDRISKNKKAFIVFFIIIILIIITFFVRKCPNRIISIAHNSIPLHGMFINMFNKDKKLLNKVSIITFDVPKKETVDYVINLNK